MLAAVAIPSIGMRDTIQTNSGAKTSMILNDVELISV